MVKLNRIYTKTGDDGTTGLAGGARVAKCSPRVEAYGAVDEANAAIGMARVFLQQPAKGNAPAQIDAVLARIQNDLFDLGADLATPEQESGEALRVVDSQVVWLEQVIDQYNASLTPLQSFVLPGGSGVSAALHMARTIVRRAERDTCALAAQEWVNPISIHYLNRLSDVFFVLARVMNGQGGKDVLWVPGANR